jgi:hypothetical protein
MHKWFKRCSHFELYNLNNTLSITMEKGNLNVIIFEDDEPPSKDQR